MPGALEGIRVLELTRVVPGALCTMMLGDMGAEVIKVETPPEAVAVSGTGSGSSPDASQIRRAAFNFTNRNKRSIAINLKNEAGRGVLHELVKGADVLIEGFRPGVMKRLNADYETLSAINPRLVYCSLSGFGKDGPYKELPGHDINYLSFGGTMGLIGQADHMPDIPLNIIADYASATLNGVVGILVALMSRERTGKGQLVDISFLDGVVALTAAVPGLWQTLMGAPAPARGEHVFSGSHPYYACYETKDGKIITVGCMEQHFWEHFCQAVGREDLIRFHFIPDHLMQGPTEEAKAGQNELRALFKTKTRDEWFDLLREKDVCVGKVLTLNEVFDDPQVRHRNMVVEIDDPVAGKITQVGIPIKLSDTPGSIRTLGPYLGQHTEAILGELGFPAAQIRQMRADGAVA